MSHFGSYCKSLLVTAIAFAKWRETTSKGRQHSNAGEGADTPAARPSVPSSTTVGCPNLVWVGGTASPSCSTVKPTRRISMAR